MGVYKRTKIEVPDYNDSFVKFTTGGKQYQLRSVKQVTRGGSGRSVWAQAGLSDATRPF